MAYFSNGSEGTSYFEYFCERCRNLKDKNDGRGPGCPIWDAHLLFNYDAAHRPILDLLIPMETVTLDDGVTQMTQGDCSMFDPVQRGA